MQFEKKALTINDICQFLGFKNSDSQILLKKVTANIDKPIIGYFTNRIPLEILHAAGFHPLRIVPNKKEPNIANGFVQVFCCSWIKSIFESFLTEPCNIETLLFSTGTCDSLQNMSDIFKKTLNIPIQTMTMPVRTKGILVHNYFKSESMAVVETLLKNHGLTKPFSWIDNLPKSVKLYNEKRRLILKLYESLKIGKINYSSLMFILQIADLFPIEDSISKLKHILLKINSNYQSVSKNIRILISGAMFDNYLLINQLDQLDNTIITDDLSFGMRNNYFIIPEVDEPEKQLDSVITSYLSKIPDSTIYDEDEAREKFIEKLIKEHKINGVVLVLQKWCDPEAFEQVQIKKLLDKKDVNYLTIEVDPWMSNVGQLQTRVEAFIEMLE